jgi:hypothetical protein
LLLQTWRSIEVPMSHSITGNLLPVLCAKKPAFRRA